MGADGGRWEAERETGGDTEPEAGRPSAPPEREPLLPLVPPAKVQRWAGTRHLGGRCARVGRTGRGPCALVGWTGSLPGAPWGHLSAKITFWGVLGVGWMRLHLPTQETRVRSLVRGDPPCLGAAKSCAPQPRACSRAAPEACSRSQCSTGRGASPQPATREKASQQRGPRTAKSPQETSKIIF